jgi:thioesterase domain-containing protein
VSEADVGGALASQITQLFSLRETELALELLSVSARVRRFRETRAPRGKARGPLSRPLQLAQGTSQLPPVICLPPTPPVSILVSYATFASTLAGGRNIWGLTRPGYGPGESLPSNLDELLAAHLEQVKEIAPNGACVLLGHSSGGWLAHALAGLLESKGLPPTALVLVDTYLPSELTPGILSVFMSWLTRYPLPQIDSEFSAFAWYFFELFARWTPAPITTPTLFLRCTDPVPGIEKERVPGRDGWQAAWKDAHTTIDVPSHHYNILLEHAGSTAPIIADWLAALAAGQPARSGQAEWSPDPHAIPPAGLILQNG